MKNKTLFFIFHITVLFPNILLAETVFVTDHLRVNLRAADDKTSDVVDVVSSGMPLTVLEATATGYKKVKMENGKEGYLLARFLVNTPPDKVRLQQAKQELANLKQENEELRGHIDELLGNNNNASLSAEETALRRNRLIREIMELRQTSNNAMEIKQQRDQLQERVVNAERELQQITREKQALEDSTNQDWFLYGGILAFTGIFLGVLIPKLGPQRKGNWEGY